MTKQQLIEDNINLVYALISREFPTCLTDEDIIQSGMLGLCQAAGKWDENRAKFSDFAWICIRYEILQEFRRRSKHKGILSLDYPQITYNNDDTQSLADLIAGEEDVPFVDYQGFINSLNDCERELIEYRLQGLTYREIAKVLGCSHQRVGERMRKCLRLWRKHVG